MVFIQIRIKNALTDNTDKRFCIRIKGMLITQIWIFLTFIQIRIKNLPQITKIRVLHQIINDAGPIQPTVFAVGM
jgi:hypothetical protein